MNDYRRLIERVQMPGDLNGRVLASACEKRSVRQRSRQPMWRTAVCAILAVVLAAGGIGLGQKGGAEREKPGEILELPRLACTFGLTAYAADAIPAANGNLVLGGGAADGDPVVMTTDLRPEREQYTNYRFRIAGEHIERLTLSMDRCGLYRVSGGQSMMAVLENPAEEAYDPEAVYGLWVPPQAFLQGQGKATLNGATLTVTARFTDGSERTDTYRLTAQQLQISRNEDGTEFLVPALEGGEGGVSGLYLESLNSVWFQWPVKGANTVSLSNRYGFRAAPGGQDGAFHSGIDIPAEAGTPVLAAAGGTVTETGFDVERGNCLVIDHGNGMETVYAHCLRLDAAVGDSVAAGQVIAAVGSTGMSTGPHLHFEVRQAGEAQNPVAYFDAATRGTLKMG